MQATNSQPRKSIGIALLLAAALLAVLFVATLPSPWGVRAHDCVDDADMHKDLQSTPVPCSTPAHQRPHHEHTIEVDGGRDRELVFKAYVPDGFREAGDSIEIMFEQSFDLPEAGTVLEKLGKSQITIGEGEAAAAAKVPIRGTIMPGNIITLAITAAHSSILTSDDYITITIKVGTGIETPETPWGPDTPRGFVSDDDPKGDKGYETKLTFVDAASHNKAPAADKNYVVVKNPISSTVPSATVRVELETHTREFIRSTDEIVVDFSGPFADPGFSLPSSMVASSIQVDYDPMDGEYKKRFTPSDVQIQGEMVTFSVPVDKDGNEIAFSGDYKITFKSLARIKNPFSAGIKTIKVSSFVSDEVDTIEAIVRRTTTVSPPGGPRESEFTLEGKGYAAGTVIIYHDADGDGKIDPGETLDSVKTVGGCSR